MSSLRLTLFVTLAACSAPPLDAHPDLAAPPDAATSACSDGHCGLKVQEWGTYTSVEASDGHALGGVHHVDEALPDWVHRRNFTNAGSYYFETLPEEPLQQLETPVLYFWADQPTDVRVQIDFPLGVVGEWYPEASQFEPAVDHCTTLAGGQMSWEITVDPTLPPSSFPAVDPENIWVPSRNVAATPLRSRGEPAESERFIFYRGLGKFDPPVHVVATRDGQIHVRNDSSDDLAAAFVLDVRGQNGHVLSLGALAAGQTRTLPVPPATRPLESYLTDARALLSAALQESGLDDDVARAMVDTWTRSWFRNEGVRVLYLAPRAWTDAYLPTTITPAPRALARTLVGRIEILSPDDEDALVAAVRDHARTQAPFDLATLGRFAEPRLRRALEQLSDGAERAYAQSLVDQAHARP